MLNSIVLGNRCTFSVQQKADFSFFEKSQVGVGSESFALVGLDSVLATYAAHAIVVKLLILGLFRNLIIDLLHDS